MATRYYIFDNQGHDWMTMHNKTGGMTLKEIRDMFCLWGHLENFAEPELILKYSLEQIADLWDICFCKVRSCKGGYEVITSGSLDYVDNYKPECFLKACEQAFYGGYEVILLDGHNTMIKWVNKR